MADLINPEYPQHVAMLALDPVFELGQLMEEGMLVTDPTRRH